MGADKFFDLLCNWEQYLVLAGGYYDVALRDFGLCLAAVALARLSATYDPPGTRRAM